MKTKNIIYIYCLLAMLWSCQSNTGKQKDKIVDGHTSTHNHDADHDHDHDADHDHDHDADHDHDHDHDADHDHDHEKKSSKGYEDEIIFTQEQAKAAGLEFEKVELREFHQVIKTSGQILSAQGDEATISATISGIVSFNKLSLSDGATLKAGESLLSISSKNIVDGDPILKAKNTFDVAKKEFERVESLIEDKLISMPEYNAAKLNYENAKASYGSFARNQTSKGSTMSSPISGFVKTRLVSEGEYVEIGQALIIVTQNKKLQLRADVSERYYSYLSGITSANFKTPYGNTIYKLSELGGKLISYGRSVANNEYYLPVNFEFNNVGQVIPGAFVEVYLLSAKRQNIVSVPISALIEDQGVYFVFVQLDDEGYIKTEVKLGVSNGDRTEILLGLNEGSTIVSKGAIHVQLASSSSAIPDAHEH